MDTAQTSPQSTSSVENCMDIDSPPSTVTYHNRYADDFLSFFGSAQDPMDRSPGSEMSVYTPTQTTVVPPPVTRAPLPSPVPFPVLHIDNTSQQNQPAAPAIVHSTNVSVPIGEENTVFNRVCSILDTALEDWTARVPDHEKDNNPNSSAVTLNVPEYLSEKIIYGQRAGENKYWEGDINLWPGHSRVVKLRRKYGEPCIFGVWVGMIHEFWNCDDGVHVFYGSDHKMYAHPGGDFGEIEGECEVFSVEGGWEMRDLNSSTQLDHFKFRPRGM